MVCNPNHAAKKKNFHAQTGCVNIKFALFPISFAVNSLWWISSRLVFFLHFKISITFSMASDLKTVSSTFGWNHHFMSFFHLSIREPLFCKSHALWKYILKKLHIDICMSYAHWVHAIIMCSIQKIRKKCIGALFNFENDWTVGKFVLWWSNDEREKKTVNQPERKMRTGIDLAF